MQLMILASLLAATVHTRGATAPTPAETPPPAAPQETGAGEAVPAPQAEQTPAVPEERRALIDSMQSGIEGGIETTARFFDSFFGGRRYADSGQSYGRVISDLYWQNREGFDPHLRLRARYNLPGLSNRVNAILGRGDTDQLLNDYESDFTDLFPTGRDEAWLAGFGYAPPWSASRRVSLGGGLRFSGGVHPYVRATYTFRQELGERTIMTLRPTGFWRNDEGFGWSVNLDVEHKLSPRAMLRFSGWAEEAELSPGIRNEVYLTYYQQLSPSKGFSVLVGMNGETEGTPPIYDYGGRITYRQRVWRDWLYVKLHVGVSWLRKTLEKDRHADPVLGFGFDLIYGTQPSKTTRPPQE